MSNKNMSADQKTARMLELMNFRYENVNEAKKDTSGNIELTRVGANGKIYGIVRENSKYYLKVSEPRDQILVENFQYLGGGQRYKGMYEHSSYSHALNVLDSYLSNLKSSHGGALVEDVEQNKKHQLVTEGGADVAAQIDRIKQVMSNSMLIEANMSPNNISGRPDKLEGPGSSTGSPSGEGDPFVDKASEFKTEREISKASEPVEDIGNPFDKGVKGERADGSEVVTGLNPSMGKSISMENPPGGDGVMFRENLSIDAEDILLDDDSVEEDEISLDDDMFGDVGGDDVPDVDVGIEPEVSSDVVGMLDDIEAKIKELSDALVGLDGGEPMDPVEDIAPADDFGVDVGMDFSPFNKQVTEALKSGKKLYVVESDGTVLNIWGDHSSYQKQPFTLPSNQNTTDNQENGAKDWTVTADNDQPFGTQIGSGAPFDEKVKLIVDSIMQECINAGIITPVNETLNVGDDWEPTEVGNHGYSLNMHRVDADGVEHGDESEGNIRDGNFERQKKK